MGLNDSQFSTDLTIAFKQVDWNECASKASKAIQDYVTSGETSTTVILVHTPVPPAPALPGPAKGNKGKIIAITSSGLTQAIVEALKGDDFQKAAEAMAEAINDFVSGCTILVTQYDPPFQGIGIGPPSSTGLMAIAPVGLDLLKVILSGAFLASVDWSVFVPIFANGVKVFVTTCVVNTVDGGIVPLTAWIGKGIGTIS